MRAAKNTTLKNQLRNFLRDENHLYEIILVHLTSNVALKTRKHLLAAGYRIFKKPSKLEISSHSLTHHSHKPRAQTKQRTVTILRHNNKLTGGMCLLGFQRVYTLCALSFLLSSIRLLVFSFIFNQAACLFFYLQSGCLSFLLSSIRLLVFFFIQRNHTETLIFHINTFFKQDNRRHKII